MRKTIGLTLAALAAVALPAQAHFNMLMPQTPPPRRARMSSSPTNGAIPTNTNCSTPPAGLVIVVAPDGNTADLTKSLEPITVPPVRAKP